MDREDGISKTPADSCVATKLWKWTLMVRRSPETRTRPSSAAIRKTSGSSVPYGIARSRLEVYRWLSSEQPFPNGGIDVSISLEADLQASLDAASFLARSKRSIIS
jgi:hypothetical protein